MSTELVTYTEPLSGDELGFLTQKEATDRSMYYRVYRILLIASFVIPFIGSWYRAAEGAPNAFSYFRFFFSAGVLVFISTIATSLSYYVYHRKVLLDIRDKTKTIEISHITRKHSIATNRAYYFLYLDSPVKISIEVADIDFLRLDKGDEVAIEYTKHSKLYLGYF